MFDEFEKEDDQWRPEPSKAGKLLNKTKLAMKWAFVAFTVIFIGFIVIRMFLSNPPSSMEKVIWNESLLSEHKKAKSEKRKFEVLQIPSEGSFSDNGSYSIYTIVYIPSAKQLQLTVRSNDRELENVKEQYPELKKDIDKKGGKIYSYSLMLSSADGAATVNEYEYTEVQRFGYTFHRLIFDNVDLSKFSSAKLSISPSVHHQTINVYNGSKSISQLSDFDYDVPKKPTSGIKKKEIKE